MRGLKGPVNDKIINFHNIVQSAAAKKNSVFFGFAGEGNEYITDTLDCEDLTGWLIPFEMADEFEKKWNISNDIDYLEEWTDYFIWAQWKLLNGEITIEFVKYDY